MKDNLDEAARNFSKLDEGSQRRTVNAFGDLRWRGSARLLAACYPQASYDVKILMAAACGQIDGAESKALLMRVVREETDSQLRWVAINSLTSLIHIRLDDMDWLYEVARSPDESVECRETAIYGLAKAIGWYRRRKGFDPAKWRERLPSLRDHSCLYDRDSFEEALRLIGAND